MESKRLPNEYNSSNFTQMNKQITNKAKSQIQAKQAHKLFHGNLLLEVRVRLLVRAHLGNVGKRCVCEFD